MPEPKKKPNYLIIPIPDDNHKEHAAQLVTNLSILIHLIYTCCPDYLKRLEIPELTALRDVVDFQIELKKIQRKKEPDPQQPQDGEPEDT
jgi:hypothetical protein